MRHDARMRWDHEEPVEHPLRALGVLLTCAALLGVALWLSKTI